MSRHKELYKQWLDDSSKHADLDFEHWLVEKFIIPLEEAESQLSAIENFLTRHENNLAEIFREGDNYIASAHHGVDMKEITEFEGSTIGEAIGKFYEALANNEIEGIEK